MLKQKFFFELFYIFCFPNCCCFFFQALLYGSCVSQKDNITKHACDEEFQALKDCIRQAVSFLVDWSGSLFFLSLISLDIMLVFKPQTQLSWQNSQMGAQKCPFREWGDKKESLDFLMQHILFSIQSLFQFKLC